MHAIMVRTAGAILSLVAAITAGGCNDEPFYVASMIHVKGSVELHDDQFGTDENLSAYVSEYVTVLPAGAEYHWSRCVGDEVTGYLDIVFTLDKDNGGVTAAWTAEAHEGTKCGRTGEMDTSPITDRPTIPPNESKALRARIYETDYVTRDLVLQNCAQTTNEDSATVPCKVP